MTPLQSALKLTQDLIAFRTVSLGSNLDLVDFVTDLLGAAGAAMRVSHSEDRTRANVFATFGPEVDGGVVLSGHTDVVPVLEAEWDTDPFEGVRRGDRIHGRGACDMKGFLGCALAMAPRFATADLQRPIHLAFTYDEEVACLGAQVLIEELIRVGPVPSAAVVGEPTGLEVVTAHKGCWEFTTQFTGVGGHGSQPAKAVNAVEYASRYVTRLMELARELRTRADDDSPFDPPHTSISVGMIEGGIGRNVVAGECRLEWEMRPVRPAEGEYVLSTMAEFAEAELLPDMRRVHAGSSITTHTVGAVRGLEASPSSEAVRLMKRLLPDPTVAVVSFGTEAGLYQAAGVPAVVWGPGDIEQAHTPNEFVTIAQLEACLDLMDRLAQEMAEPSGPGPARAAARSHTISREPEERTRNDG